MENHINYQFYKPIGEVDYSMPLWSDYRPLPSEIDSSILKISRVLDPLGELVGEFALDYLLVEKESIVIDGKVETIRQVIKDTSTSGYVCILESYCEVRETESSIRKRAWWIDHLTEYHKGLKDIEERAKELYSSKLIKAESERPKRKWWTLGGR